ncbi:MAG: GtrA family protein [Gammaproteobacteria bacterium]
MAFTLVGLVGLAIDAGLFTLLTRNAHWLIAPARTVSVCCMVFVTWLLNRVITFAEHRSPRRGAEFVRYAAVQASGLVVNIGVFALCLRLSPTLREAPLVPLLLGAAAGFAFNFTVMRTLVFRGASGPT